MKILVTGGAGFIGSNLAESLANQGHQVRVLDDFSLGKRENLEGLNVELIEGSIEDESVCRSACKGVDAISHQAAFGSVPRSIEQPALYSKVNVHGFVTLADAARREGIKRFIYASSSSVYGDIEDSPKVEERTGTLLSPYASSKAADEVFAQSFATAYGMTFVGLRYFNVFGPKQDPNGAYAAVIPLFIKHILQNRRASIFGDGEQSRDFTYVGNVVQANTACLTQEGLTGSHVINVGCGETTTVNMLYGFIAKILETKLEAQYKPTRPGDVLHSLANIDRAKKLIDYDPGVGLEEGLGHTVRWFLDNKEVLEESASQMQG